MSFLVGCFGPISVSPLGLCAIQNLFGEKDPKSSRANFAGSFGGQFVSSNSVRAASVCTFISTCLLGTPAWPQHTVRGSEKK